METDVLRIWLEYLGLSRESPARIDDYLTVPIRQAASYDFIQGWGSGSDTPNLVANASDQHVRIPGNMPPHSVAVHPSPNLTTAVGWRCPTACKLRIEGTVRHAHPECGNGISWSCELRRGAQRKRLASGTAQGERTVAIGPIEPLQLQAGDLVSLLISPRDGNHACDLTGIDLTLVELNGEQRRWNLADDVASNVLAGNPHADRFGNAEVWHFYTEPTREATPNEMLAPSSSLLSRWHAAETSAARAEIGAALQTLLVNGCRADDTSPDAELYRQLASLRGPLLTTALRLEPHSSDDNNPSAPADFRLGSRSGAIWSRYGQCFY